MNQQFLPIADPNNPGRLILPRIPNTNTDIDSLIPQPNINPDQLIASQYINKDFTLLSAGVRNGNTFSLDQVNDFYGGLILFLNITANNSAAGIIPYIQVKDSFSANYYKINAAVSAITTVGNFSFIFYPGVSGMGNDFTQINSMIIPHNWRLFINHLDTSNINYSVNATYIL